MNKRDGSDDPRCAFAISVVERLRSAGHEALWAGGCVRDRLMGTRPDDYDVATSARPEDVQKLFRRTIEVGAAFGVVVVAGNRRQGQVEVATFRTEGGYSDGRRPDQVQFSTAEEDAKRRDFTINGMFYDPLRGQLLDYVGGQRDLAERTVRAIGDPVERFDEDKLRLLRAIRFTARFRFSLDAATREAVEEMAAEIAVVSSERILQELRRMLQDCNRRSAMELTLDTGLLIHFLREPASLNEDAWTETLTGLDQLDDSLRLVCTELGHGGADRDDIGQPHFALAMAMLLHHNDCLENSATELEAICRRLKMSNHERTDIFWLLDHQRALCDATTMPLSQLKRLLVHESIVDLLVMHHSLAVSRGDGTEHVTYCCRVLAETPSSELNPPPLITGNNLRDTLALSPGPLFKKILDHVRDAQLDGLVETKNQALECARQFLASQSGDQ